MKMSASSKYNKYIGRILDGRYRIDELIGIGGMAVVFGAFDEKDGKKVAVKLLREEIASDVASVKRFINESKAVAMLDHPNIVKIYNVAVSDEYKYIVMEYIDGITLKKYIKKKGTLRPQIAIAITEQVLSALEHAHSKGIIHRDIKPHNIMILKTGKVVVTDFGIAQVSNGESNPLDGKAVGTVFYISPEQASGKPTDARSDLYSLGAMIYEMAVGQLPFYSENPLDVARMQIHSNPKSPREINPNVPKGLEEVILHAMKKAPSERFQSAKEMHKYISLLQDDIFSVFSFDKLTNEESDSESSDENGEEKPIKKIIHKERSGSLFPIVLGSCLSFLIVAVVVGYYAFQNIILKSNLNVFKHDTSGEIVIGDYVDTEYSKELEKSLKASGYNVKVEYEFNEDYASGVICKQEPEEGAIRKSGKFELILTVSKGIEIQTIANYTMDEYRQTKLSLEKKGFAVKIQYIRNEAIDTGYVISTDPSAGSVVPKGSLVVVYVSSGPEIINTTVPDLTNYTVEQVRELLSEGYLRLGNVKYEYSDTFEKDHVISQYPLPGSIVAQGEFIDLIISDGLTESAE